MKLHGKISSYYARGKTLDWIFTDSKEFFDEQLEENPNDKNLLWYKDNPIKYQINKDGFRLPYELTKEEGNVYLGCSFPSHDPDPRFQYLPSPIFSCNKCAHVLS